MQILKDKTRSTGELLVQIENLDDLWLLYNIIRPGDFIKGKTSRRVVIREGETGTRQTMTLKIAVEKTEFHEFSNVLRVLGTIVEGPKDLVSYGDHHTFNLEPGKRYWVIKNKWYKNDIERIRKSLSHKKASLVLVVAIENGIANLAIISDYSLTPITEVKKNIPGKRFGRQQFDKMLVEFFNAVKSVIEDNIQRMPISLLIICGPGFTKEEFMAYLKKNSEIIKKNNVALRVVNASSGELSGVYEILKSGEIAAQKKDFRFAQDAEYINRFIEHLGKQDGLIAYGLEEVLKASQTGAVEHLLICDKLLRTADDETREKVEEALNNTEIQGGQVHILSTLAPPGQQLEAYGMIAALLRYRIDY